METNEHTLSAAALLETAHKAVSQGYPCDDRLARAALHLIECATDVVIRLPDRDIDSAREALGLARAAVVTATCAVREIHAQARETSEPVSLPTPGRPCGRGRAWPGPGLLRPRPLAGRPFRPGQKPCPVPSKPRCRTTAAGLRRGAHVRALGFVLTHCTSLTLLGAACFRRIEM